MRECRLLVRFAVAQSFRWLPLYKVFDPPKARFRPWCLAARIVRVASLRDGRYPARPFELRLAWRGDRIFRMEQSLPQELVKQVAGSFRLTALLQKRVRELVRGQRPLFETRERNFIKIAHEELKRGLIELVADEDARTAPMMDNNA